MFDELKGKLSAFERRVEGAFVKVETSVRALRVEVETMDKDLLAPFDKLKALVVKTRGSVAQELQKVRAELDDLEPPR